MKKISLNSPLAVKLILGLAAFMACLIPLQVVLLFVSMNKWLALGLKLLFGHAGVVVLFKWLRKHSEGQRPRWFPGLVKGALAGAEAYLLLTITKFLVGGGALLDLIRVLCPICLSMIGAYTHKE